MREDQRILDLHANSKSLSRFLGYNISQVKNLGPRDVKFQLAIQTLTTCQWSCCKSPDRFSKADVLHPTSGNKATASGAKAPSRRRKPRGTTAALDQGGHEGEQTPTLYTVSPVKWAQENSSMSAWTTSLDGRDHPHPSQVSIPSESTWHQTSDDQPRHNWHLSKQQQSSQQETASHAKSEWHDTTQKASAKQIDGMSQSVRSRLLHFGAGIAHTPCEDQGCQHRSRLPNKSPKWNR